MYWFLKLLLTICLNRVLNVVKKSLKLTQAIMHKGFKYFFNNKNIIPVFYPMLILLPLKLGCLLEKTSYK